MGGVRSNIVLMTVCVCLVLSMQYGLSDANANKGLMTPKGFHYPPEHIYDTRQSPNGSLTNVHIASSRWPDCRTFETTVQSIFRIEGVATGTDQEKALALWKWVRILMSATGTGYAYEGDGPGKERVVFDGHKILTVYGHHQCDGLSWTMVPLWRAAGYMALDEASHSHTTVSLRYQDEDGTMRFHSFDPRGGFIWWNPERNIVGNRTLPLMQDSVHRHLTLPQKVHSLKTTLHQHETIQRRWRNTGHVVPYGRHESKIVFDSYSGHRIGRKDGIYSSAGMEIQQFSPDLTSHGYQKDLHPLSGNLQLSGKDTNSLLLHPAEISKKARAVYCIHSSYAAVNATVTMTYRLMQDSDRLTLYMSRDGENWQPVYEAETKGENTVEIDLGRKKRNLSRPSIYTAYTFFLKIGMTAAQNVQDAGVKDFSVKVYRTLNKRTLPTLLPGDNTFRVSADDIMPGKTLSLAVNYQVKGDDYSEQHLIKTFPYYFNIRVKGAGYDIRDSYDKVFDLGDIRMTSISMHLVNDSENIKNTSPALLTPAQGEKAFEISSPLPVGKGVFKKRVMTSPALGTALADGFFPQKDAAEYTGKDRKAYVAELIKTLKTGKDSSAETWRAAEALGGFPDALDALLEELPSADIDLTLFICKSLARIPSPKSIAPLLKKWEQAPSGAPGTRYIPDVLAAIGDPKVVPYLTEKLKHVRFDFRFHIARALGILGGTQARKALEDLAVNDPFPAVRQMAKTSLSKLR